MSTQRYYQEIKKLLSFHKIISPDKEVNNRNLKSLIMSFQEKESILIDGIVGPDTLWRLQYAYTLSSPKLNWVRCEADIIPGKEGYHSLLLREDAAVSYKKLRNEVLSRGGVITTAGGKRNLNEEVNQHRSSKSMHYPGLAFDLSVTTGFFDPENDPYVIVKNDRNAPYYWTVYCRAPGGEEMTLQVTYWKGWNGGKDFTQIIRGRFINFTELCIHHGFFPIPPRSAYLRDKDKLYLSAEWWHFQANNLLIPNFSVFGIELLKIEDYTPEYLKLFKVWEKRQVVFGIDWK